MTNEDGRNPELEGIDEDDDAEFDEDTFQDVFVLGDPPHIPDALWESAMSSAFDGPEPDDSLYPPGSVDRVDESSVAISDRDVDESDATGGNSADTPADDSIWQNSADEANDDDNG